VSDYVDIIKYYFYFQPKKNEQLYVSRTPKEHFTRRGLFSKILEIALNFNSKID